MGSVPALMRSPGGGKGNPLQCSCLDNPMDREAWWVTVRGVAAKSQTRLSRHASPSVIGNDVLAWRRLVPKVTLICMFPALKEGR